MSTPLVIKLFLKCYHVSTILQRKEFLKDRTRTVVEREKELDLRRNYLMLKQSGERREREEL